MGCRPSRRAVACVRVAGDNSWGSARSNRPRTIAGDNAVKLRHRGSRRSRDEEGRDEGGNGGPPRDRYSAPPVDKHFPPHSCTSAVYEHGCCGTSRITLRLSKNGSTLEIEKCDFEHGVKSCQVCGTPGPQKLQQPSLDTPLRAQSAPNLTTTVQDTKSGKPQHTSLQSRNKQMVNSQFHPPPLPMRHMERLSVMTGASVVSPPESVCTANRISVDIESVPHSQPCSSNDSNFYTTRESTSNRMSRPPVGSAKRPETLYFPKLSGSFPDLHSDVQMLNENDDTFSCPYSPSSEDLCKLLRDADGLLSGDYNVGSEAVDLTKLESTNVSEDNSDDDDESECASIVDLTCSRTPVDDIDVVESSNNTSSDSMYDDTVDSESNETSVLIHSSVDNSHSKDVGVGDACNEDGKPTIPGATDYRVRMLGAQKNAITSQLTSREPVQCYKSDLVTEICEGKTILVSCNDSAPREDNYRDDNVEPTADHMVNGSEEGVSHTAPSCQGRPVAGSAEMTIVPGRSLDMPSDQGNVGDRQGKAALCQPPGETPQTAFFYADYENDNVEDVQEDSTSRLESLC